MRTNGFFRKIGLMTGVMVMFAAWSANAQKYPYATSATDGPIIVFNDGDGIPTSALRTSKRTTAMPSHTEDNTTYNKPYKKMQVYNTDSNSGNGIAWASAEAKCPSGWRLPTQTELQLIWTMGGGAPEKYYGTAAQYNAPATVTPLYSISGFTTLAAAYYWSATEPSNFSNSAWYVDFSSGHTINGNKTNSIRVRCVRDVD